MDLECVCRNLEEWPDYYQRQVDFDRGLILKSYEICGIRYNVVEDVRQYHRIVETGELVHRDVARRVILPYLLEWSYDFDFEEMVVHHVDFCKQNNVPENLEILTWEDHSRLHGFGEEDYLSY